MGRQSARDAGSSTTSMVRRGHDIWYIGIGLVSAVCISDLEETSQIWTCLVCRTEKRVKQANRRPAVWASHFWRCVYPEAFLMLEVIFSMQNVHTCTCKVCASCPKLIHGCMYSLNNMVFTLFVGLIATGLVCGQTLSLNRCWWDPRRAEVDSLVVEEWQSVQLTWIHSMHCCAQQGCKRDLSLRDRDETETFGFWSETRPRPRPSCNSTRPRRDRDVWFLPRDETATETLQGRDRDVYRDLQPSALCQNNEWRTCLSWCHKQLSHCNCNCSVHYHKIYSPHKH